MSGSRNTAVEAAKKLEKVEKDPNLSRLFSAEEYDWLVLIKERLYMIYNNRA